MAFNRMRLTCDVCGSVFTLASSSNYYVPFQRRKSWKVDLPSREHLEAFCESPIIEEMVDNTTDSLNEFLAKHYHVDSLVNGQPLHFSITYERH